MSGVPRDDWAALQPHGTVAAARRHYRAGEPPCDPCREAESRRRRKYLRKRRPPSVHLDVAGHPRCGHPRFSRLTADESDVTCGHCLMLMAGLSSTSGLTWAEQQHGTLAAYRRHYRRGEKPCESCRQAKTRDNEDRYRRRRAA